MSKNKHRRTFKIKHQYHSEVKYGITYVHMPDGDPAAVQDVLYFLNHPDQSVYLRPAGPYEFAFVRLPDGMKLEDIRYVLVKRLPGGLQQMRIPLTIEQMADLKDPAFFGYAASGE
jgi:hypothetical protein